MTEVLHTPNKLEDYFSLAEAVAATASADAMVGMDNNSRRSVLVWVYRKPLEINSTEVRNFLDRMRKIDQIDPIISDMMAFGVDSEGMAFSVFPGLMGNKINLNINDHIEAERRLVAILAILENLHASGVCCGDLCIDSFWVNREGQVKITALLGLAHTECSDDYLHNVAPELIRDQDGVPVIDPKKITAASDVFSLGVIAYELFAAGLPYGSGYEGFETIKSGAAPKKPISNEKLPKWFANIVLKAVHYEPAKRYRDAGDFLRALQEARGAGYTTLPALSGSRKARHDDEDEDLPENLRSFSESRQAVTFRYVSIAAILALVSIFTFIAYRYFFATRPSTIAEQVDLGDLGNPELGQAIAAMNQNDAPEEEQAEQVRKLSSSADPLAHHLLIDQALQSNSTRIRFLSQKAILDRARSAGFPSTADQTYRWLQKVSGGEDLKQLREVFKLLDPNLPKDQQQNVIYDIRKFDPDLALRFAVSLGFDQKDLDRMKPVIVNLMSLNMDQASRSAYSIIVKDPALSRIFSDQLANNVELMTETDFFSALSELAKRKDRTLETLADLAIKRKYVVGIAQIYVDVLREARSIPNDVAEAMVVASQRSLSQVQLTNLIKWNDQRLERILLALFSDAKQVTEVEIFDRYILMNRNIEPVATISDYVVQNFKNDREKFMRLLGMLAFKDIYSVNEITAQLNELKNIAGINKFMIKIFATKDSRVVAAMVRIAPDSIEITDKILLLNHPDKNVRSEILQTIQTNDLGALKLIAEAFDKEKDEQIKEIYRKQFWSLADR